MLVKMPIFRAIVRNVGLSDTVSLRYREGGLFTVIDAQDELPIYVQLRTRAITDRIKALEL